MERGCELCDATAALYCGADEAYICWSCDVKVHSANFLVARHTRMVLCKICCRPTTLRASGADPAPLSHLCVSCSSESECNKSLDPLEEGEEEAVSVDMIPLRSSSAGASESGYGSGCDSCNNLEERPEVQKNSGGGQKRRALPVETISSVGIKEEDSSKQARPSVESLDGSHGMKKRKLSLGLPDAAEQTGQSFRSLEEVKRARVAETQCNSSRPTTAQDGERETQANVGEGVDTPSTTMSSRRSFNTGVHCPSKQPLVVDSSQTRSSLPARHYQHTSSVQSTARLRRMLAEWHWDLNLSSPSVVPLALRLYRKVFRALCPANNASSAAIRSTLAACLRLAAILDDAQINVPKPHEFASCAAISRRHLAMTEIQLTAFLGRGRLLMLARGLTIERPQ